MSIQTIPDQIANILHPDPPQRLISNVKTLHNALLDPNSTETRQSPILPIESLSNFIAGCETITNLVPLIYKPSFEVTQTQLDG